MIFTAILFFVFLVSGGAKLFGMSQFTDTVSQLGFTGTWSRAIAWLVVLGEIAVSVCLWFPSMFALGNMLAGMLLTSFYWAHYRSRRQSAPVPCNCFGSIKRDNLSTKTLYRVVVLSFVWIGAWVDSEPLSRLIPDIKM